MGMIREGWDDEIQWAEIHLKIGRITFGCFFCLPENLGDDFEICIENLWMMKICANH